MATDSANPPGDSHWTTLARRAAISLLGIVAIVYVAISAYVYFRQEQLMAISMCEASIPVLQKSLASREIGKREFVSGH